MRKKCGGRVIRDVSNHTHQGQTGGKTHPDVM